MIELLTYLDDILGAGNYELSRNVILNASEIETNKKFTFNIEKSNYMIMKTENDKEHKIME